MVGDIVFFYISLWVMLFIRYSEFPSDQLFRSHLEPFSILFLVWLVIFFIAGLYERHTSMMRSVMPATLLQTLLVNGVVAVLFFYFIPSFGITPKTNLFLYLVVSLIFLALWRLVIYPTVIPKNRQNVLLIARGEEMKDLRDEINNSNYGYRVEHSINLDNVETIDVKEDIINQVYAKDVTTIIIDTKDDTVIPLLPHLYNLMFSNVSFIDMHNIYEYVFTKVPLSLVKHGWFLENVRSRPHIMYDAMKRITDIFVALIAGTLSLVIYPFVWAALKIEDGGELFSVQKRIGQGNKEITLLKFRTMAFNDGGNWEKDGKENYVTKVGAFLRNTRIDELPQLWSVLRGQVSLIGPRPEFAKAVKEYAEDVPFYNVRHLIKPGLSGWAQMYQENHPHHGVDIEATKEKLSYDLYYVKNRSFLLDLKIILQTLKTFVSRSGK